MEHLSQGMVFIFTGMLFWITLLLSLIADRLGHIRKILKEQP